MTSVCVCVCGVLGMSVQRVCWYKRCIYSKITLCMYLHIPVRILNSTANKIVAVTVLFILLWQQSHIL